MGFIKRGKENFVWKLKWALYGLHQAGREWFLELDGTFIEFGIIKVQECNCIYSLQSKMIILVCVDDFAIFAEKQEVVD